MTRDEEIRQGRNSERVLNDPLFKAAFDHIESNLINALKRMPIGDRDGQHEVVLMLQLMNRLQGFFTEMIETGKMATLQQEGRR